MTDRYQLAEAAILEARTNADDINEALLDVPLETWEDATRLLHHLRLARQSLAASESTMETRCAQMLADAGVRDPQEVDGIGTVQLRKGNKRKEWDHSGLASRVLDRHLTTAGTGEMPSPWTVRDWLLEVLAPSYWRVGVLKQLDIDPDDYCQTSPGRPTVQITTNEGRA